MTPLLARGEGPMAERTDDNNNLRAEWQARGAMAVIPPWATRVEAMADDSEMSKWRCLVENFLSHLHTRPSHCHAL